MEVRKFPYRQSIRAFVGSGVAVAAATLVAVYIATQHESWKIAGWIAAVSGFYIASYCFYIGIRRKLANLHVVLSPEGIAIPGLLGGLTGDVFVPYAEIYDLRCTMMVDTQVLEIFTDFEYFPGQVVEETDKFPLRGAPHIISSAMLPTGAFEELVSLLEIRSPCANDLGPIQYPLVCDAIKLLCTEEANPIELTYRGEEWHKQLEQEMLAAFSSPDTTWPSRVNGSPSEFVSREEARELAAVYLWQQLYPNRPVPDLVTEAVTS